MLMNIVTTIATFALTVSEVPKEVTLEDDNEAFIDALHILKKN